jgi:hypothetical protein
MLLAGREGLEPGPAAAVNLGGIANLLVDLLPEPAGTPPRYLRLR